MNLQSLVTLPVRTASSAGMFFRKMAHAVIWVSAMIPAHYATAESGGVYVAGQGSGLDQAFKQALAAHPHKEDKPFWIVIAGKEVSRVTKGGAGPSVTGWVNTVRERGGLMYVCRSDMMKAGIKEGDLLEGVISMYGYSAKDWAGLLPARKEGITLPTNMQQSQLILKTCAGEEKPAS